MAYIVRALKCGSVISLLLSFFTCLVAADISHPNSGSGKTRVEVTFKILDIDSINSQDQSFEANIFIRAAWKDLRLQHDGPGPIGLDVVDAWSPELQIVSQQKAWRTFKDRLRVYPDGNVVWRQRLWGSFSQPMNLRDFPFDQQTFVVQVLSTSGERSDEVELVASQEMPGTIAENLSVADWTVSSPQIKLLDFNLSQSGRPLSLYEFTFTAERKSGYFIVKVIIPLLLIVAMSWIVFWIDPTEFGTQISVAITSMLTLIAYRFAIDTLLPNVSYLTSLDYFILGSTMLIFATLIEVVVTGNLAKRDNGKEKARSIDRCCRLVCPILFLIIAVESLWLRFLM